MKTFKISNDPRYFEAFPDVVRLPSGRLVCVFLECTHHGDRSFARIVWTLSDDRGRTWSPKRVLVARDDQGHYNCGQISCLRDGRLAIVLDYIRGTPFGEDSENYLFFSEDDGESFGPPVLTPVRGVVPTRLVELTDGRWLIAAHGPHPETGTLAELLWFSDDQGTHWSGPVTLASDPELNLCEASILPLPDGRLAAFLRENSNLGLPCHKTISDDRGEHWGPLHKVPIPGCHRPKAGWLQSGNALISARVRHGHKWAWGANQLTVAAYMDAEAVGSTAWEQQRVRLFPVSYDRSPVADTGYTGWTQFDDGEIYLVNYLVDDAKNGQIRGFSFTEDEIVLTHDANAAPTQDAEKERPETPAATGGFS